MKIHFPSAQCVAAMAGACRDPALGTRRMCWATLLGLAVGAVVAHPSHAAAIPPRRLLEVVDLGNPAMSPDGRSVAFRMEQASVERNTYDTTWYVQALDGHSLPRRVSEGGAPLRDYVSGGVLPSPTVWSPDGRWIYYRARFEGRVSVWRAAADGSGARALTSDAADVRDFVLSGDGRSLCYSIGAPREEVMAAEASEYDQGVRIDDSVMLAAGVSRSSMVEGRPATQRFLGGWFSVGPLLAEAADRWKAVDLTTLATRDLAAAEVPSQPALSADLPTDLLQPSVFAVHPDDGRVAVVVPVENRDESLLVGRETELMLLPAGRSARPVRCTAEPCRHQTITGIQWRPGSDEVLFTTTHYDRGRTQSIHGWNVMTGVVQPIVVSDGLVSGGQRHWDVPCALSFKTLVCVAAEADRPPRLEAIDVTSGERRILFEPNKALELDIAARAPASLIQWTDKRGRVFTGHLFEAHASVTGEPPPLFVTFYNCFGFLRGGVGNEWPLASMAERGISSLCINALPEFRLDFVERHDQGRLAVEGVVKFLSSEGRIDPGRVGMGGLSFGSEVTLWTAANSDLLAAASVSGVSPTPTYYLFNSLRDGFRAGLGTSWQLGAPEETPERWREVSPTFHLDRIRAPILFQVPEQEYRMILDYALPLVRRHQGDIYVFPDEPHIKFQPRHKLAAYERNLDWFRFWLQGYEDSDPIKTEQYRLWNQMRSDLRKNRSHAGGDDGA